MPKIESSTSRRFSDPPASIAVCIFTIEVESRLRRRRATPRRRVAEQDAIADAELLPREVAGIDLERGAVGRCRGIARTTLGEIARTWLHRQYGADSPDAVDEGDVERDACPKHPERRAVWLGVGIKKEHSGVGCE